MQYSCPVCGKSFDTFKGMRTHMWKMHPFEYREMRLKEEVKKWGVPAELFDYIDFHAYVDTSVSLATNIQDLVRAYPGLAKYQQEIEMEDIEMAEEKVRKANIERGIEYIEETIEEVLQQFKNGEKEEIREHLREILGIEEKKSEKEEEIERRIEELERKLEELIRKKRELEEKEKVNEKREIKEQLEEVNPDIEIVEVKYENGLYKVTGKIKPGYENYFLTKYVDKPIIAEGVDVETVKTAFNAEVSKRHKSIPVVAGRAKEVVARQALPIPKMFVGKEIPEDYFYQHACPHILKSFDPEVFRQTGVLRCEECIATGKFYNRSVEEGRKLAGVE